MPGGGGGMLKLRFDRDINKLYSLAYKVQPTFFVPAKKEKKPELSEQQDTCLLLN